METNTPAYAAQLTEPEYRELVTEVATSIGWGGGA